LACVLKHFDIIFDTNVLVAGLRSKRGASNELMQRLNDPCLTVHVSNTLLFEYEEVLRRNQAVLGMSGADIGALLDGFCRLGVKHFTPFLWRPAVRDPDDDFLVDLAVAARATHLITHNLADFRTSQRWGINVLAPADFLAILRAAYE